VMLERLLFKHLTKKGITAYFIGTLTLFAILAYYLLAIIGYSLEEGRTPFFIGIVILNILWAGICLVFWKKPTKETK
ncbi:hypothetical protein, partial [Tenacibaculum maritimum]